KNRETTGRAHCHDISPLVVGPCSGFDWACQPAQQGLHHSHGFFSRRCPLCLRILGEGHAFLQGCRKCEFQPPALSYKWIVAPLRALQTFISILGFAARVVWMQAKDRQAKESGARRRTLSRALFCALLGSTLIVVEGGSAAAFELFGIKLWNSASDKEDAEIVDPLRYSVSIEVPDADKDLHKKLEAASALKGDEERPVSGSLGLMTKARSDREQLVAALYANAYYEGIVNITIDGKKLDELPPDAEFNGPQPVPVVVTIQPGQKFVLGNIRLEGDAAGLMGADYGLIAGGDASSVAVLKAEARIVRALKEEGRPLAKVTGREIVADHATSTLDVTLTLAAGPIAGYGETTV